MEDRWDKMREKYIKLAAKAEKDGNVELASKRRIAADPCKRLGT